MQYSKELLTIRDTHNVPWLIDECTKASNVFAEKLTQLIASREQEIREEVLMDYARFKSSNVYGKVPELYAEDYLEEVQAVKRYLAQQKEKKHNEQ